MIQIHVDQAGRDRGDGSFQRQPVTQGRRVLLKASEEIRHIRTQDQRHAVEDDAEVSGPIRRFCVEDEIASLISLHQDGSGNPLQVRGDRVDDGKGIRQHPSVDDQRAGERPAKLRQEREMQMVQRQIELSLVLRARLSGKPGKGSRDARQAHVGFGARRGQAPLHQFQRVAEDDLRVLHHRVLRLEALDQLAGAVQRDVQVDGEPGKLRIPAADGLVQRIRRPPHRIEAADQGVIVLQDRAARLQHVALQRGIARVDRPQRLQRPLVARIVGGHAEDEQGRQDTEHPSHSAEKDWQAVQRVVSPRGDVGPVGLAPFSVSRNFTMRRTSLAGTVRLSWLAAISPTAASSVAARPS